MSLNFGQKSSRQFDKGDENECVINKAIFFFFDEDGNQVAKPFITTNKGNEDASGTEGPGTLKPVDDNGLITKTGAIVLLKNPSSLPTRLVVVLNPSSRLESKTLGGLTINNLQALQGYYILNVEPDKNAWKAGDKPVCEPDIFTITNSRYITNGENKLGTQISHSDFHKTVAEAKANPVIVPVERIISRVNITVSDQLKKTLNPDSESNNNIVTVDGQEETVDVEFTGCWLDNVNNQSYLFKKLDNYDFSWSWNDVPNYRSYWATPASPINGYQHYRYSDQKQLTTALSLYTLENTDQDNPTQLVVAARLKFPATKSKSLQQASVHPRRGLLYYKGKFYTKEKIEQVLVNHSILAKYYIKDNEGNYHNLKAADYTNSLSPAADDLNQVEFYDLPVDIKSSTTSIRLSQIDCSVLKSYEIYLVPQLNARTTQVYELDKSGNYVLNKTREQINDEWATNSELHFKVMFWRQMKAYYYIPVKHIIESHKNAVIRNHIYRLKINSVRGLGTPVSDTGKDYTLEEYVNDPEIIPEKPQYVKSYIGVEFNVLPWRDVEIPIDFK